ncbi:fimbrial protein [Pseudomonas fragi]|uniref:Fimbrial protein n=1 Tax=Pseudomonas fragi TaxID=296 RepID=A0A266LPY5_PSEFR|nr:fimbrial protein [Pseudomonas fragi]OZY39720.1 fimbrial protein [Pseudomonas fragi]
MKKLYLAILSLSVLAASGSTFAEPVTVKGGSGQINFMGIINNDACSVDGSTGKDKVISVDMGNVSIKDMGSDTAPNAGRISANDFNLKVNCNAGTKVSMVFKPNLNGGSGLVTGKKVLKLQGTDAAKGVGIALLDSDGALIDLTSDTTALVKTGLSGEKAVGGDGTLSFAAAYVITGEAASAVAGTGNATLPFVLQYE